VEDAEYIDNFHSLLKRFFQALGGIVPIFTYMVGSALSIVELVVFFQC
jgi:hypothetical protein